MIHYSKCNSALGWALCLMFSSMEIYGVKQKLWDVSLTIWNLTRWDPVLMNVAGMVSLNRCKASSIYHKIIKVSYTVSCWSDVFNNVMMFFLFLLKENCVDPLEIIWLTAWIFLSSWMMLPLVAPSWITSKKDGEMCNTVPVAIKGTQFILCINPLKCRVLFMYTGPRFDHHCVCRWPST